MTEDDKALIAETPGPQIFHVYPVNDLKEHLTQLPAICWCDPELKIEDDGLIIIHNSLDGREAYEDGRRKCN